MTATDQRRIAKSYVFGNGMVMTFDQYGEQMPDYQGTREEVWEKVKLDAPPGAILDGNAHWPIVVERTDPPRPPGAEESE